MVIATRLEDRLISPTSEIIPAIYVIRNSFLHDFPSLARLCFLAYHRGDERKWELPVPTPAGFPIPKRATAPWNPAFFDLATAVIEEKKCLTWHKGSAIMGASITQEIQQYSLWRV
jgi:hypothetical protein